MAKRKAVCTSSGDAEDNDDRNTDVRDTVAEANALKHRHFRDRIENFRIRDPQEPATLSLRNARELDDATLQQYLSLIEQTSRHDYEPSSFGWHPRRKMREMKEKDMWYMRAGDIATGDFLGFLSFMLTYDSTPVIPVSYIYEIHLTKQARGQGLGKWLVNAAEDIAQVFGMDKVMLTCFKSNVNAYDFYTYLGYAVDASSPEDRHMRKKLVKTDYVIMSKNVNRASSGATANGNGKKRAEE